MAAMKLLVDDHRNFLILTKFITWDCSLRTLVINSQPSIFLGDKKISWKCPWIHVCPYACVVQTTVGCQFGNHFQLMSTTGTAILRIRRGITYMPAVTWVDTHIWSKSIMLFECCNGCVMVTLVHILFMVRINKQDQFSAEKYSKTKTKGNIIHKLVIICRNTQFWIKFNTLK